MPANQADDFVVLQTCGIRITTLLISEYGAMLIMPARKNPTVDLTAGKGAVRLRAKGQIMIYNAVIGNTRPDLGAVTSSFLIL